ncbi:hypothetical protein [Aneurinibacillus tyrosinisolvens]|uniref:hypothetical protein n=1 Tax=Aneurinibacillus tyrosinisolvens TaxID=1443435 RepID=UPI000B03760D|nr:hypothetical protein [Aneurinibacillus tyrosinisolvens]
MADYTKMSTGELMKLASKYEHEEFELMKELVRRGVGNNVPDTLEHPDMHLTEEDI